ncbi:SANT/Myb-like DNA-binding domain-containing protein [Bacteriovoracaceae bacterium]|nr:SANT/Myb-like DNA-binding domain-containing protein [Bacteriovoracaceae bacterium]
MNQYRNILILVVLIYRYIPTGMAAKKEPFHPTKTENLVAQSLIELSGSLDPSNSLNESTNHLECGNISNAQNNRAPLSQLEAEKVVKLWIQHGNEWEKISTFLVDRTALEVRDYMVAYIAKWDGPKK